jgi:serine/threonine protein kinase
VQKAFWPSKAEFVAIKKISVLEREKRHQLMNDIKALCAVPDVAGLVRFRGAYHCADRGQIAVALEYMDGGSLTDVLERVGRIPENVLAAMTRQVLLGLTWLHAHHTVHRDIKPANILMSTSGEPKVSDFGISAFVDNTLAQCHTFLGTVTYMSPERINGKPYSFPADIWALGLTLLECITGRYPYDATGGTIQLMIQLMEDDPPLPPEGVVSKAFRDFVRRCMAKDPLQRPTAEELLRHPFITQAGPVDLRAFMRCMYDPEEKIADGVMVVSARFYNNLALNRAESDVIASFYDAEAVLTTGAAGMPETAARRLRGRYTIAAHWAEVMMHLGGDASFEMEHQRHSTKSKSSNPKLSVETLNGLAATKVSSIDVTMSQRVCVRGKWSHVDETAVSLGVYDEVMTVRFSCLDSLQPGAGFTILAHELQWVEPLVPRRTAGGDGSATPPKCRQQ